MNTLYIHHVTRVETCVRGLDPINRTIHVTSIDQWGHETVFEIILFPEKKELPFPMETNNNLV